MQCVYNWVSNAWCHVCVFTVTVSGVCSILWSSLVDISISQTAGNNSAIVQRQGKHSCSLNKLSFCVAVNLAQVGQIGLLSSVKIVLCNFIYN